MAELHPEGGEEERIADDAGDREMRLRGCERRLVGGGGHPEPYASGPQQKRSRKEG